MMTPTYQKGQLYTLSISDLTRDADQPRKYLDPGALAELAASIREHGVLEPIIFRCGADLPILYIVAGERRVEAAKMAGLTTIPAVFVEGNHAEIALVENLLRQDLTAIEEAEALHRVMKEHGYKQEELSRVIGKAPSTLSEILSLNRLPQEIRDECRGNRTVSRRILVEIARRKQKRSMLTLYSQYKEKSLLQDRIKKQARRGQARRSVTARAIGFINTVQVKIPALAMDEFIAADREALVHALEDLQRIIAENHTALRIAQ